MPPKPTLPGFPLDAPSKLHLKKPLEGGDHISGAGVLPALLGLMSMGVFRIIANFSICGNLIPWWEGPPDSRCLRLEF